MTKDHFKNKSNDELYYHYVSGSSNVAKVLIENGADVNAKNIQGDTPLHLAAFYGKIAPIIDQLNSHATKC